MSDNPPNIGEMLKEIELLRAQKSQLRFACLKALNWATGQHEYACGDDTIQALAEEVAPALEDALKEAL